MFLGALCLKMRRVANVLQGKKDEAEPFSRRSLKMREEARGSEHPSVAVSMKNLADILEAQVRSKTYFNLVGRSECQFNVPSASNRRSIFERSCFGWFNNRRISGNGNRG